ncbi:MAG: 2OG-Fe(II) oxygenase [Rhodanobacteraceae bacterium]
MHQLALRDCVRWYDHALPLALCARLIAAFSKFSDQHVRRAPGWRPGLDDSAWTELDITPLADDSLKRFFFRQIEEYLEKYNSEMRLSIPVPNSKRLAEFRMKRYRPNSGEKFQLHFDSINEVCDRFLVFLWYLNDVTEGGETEFPDFNVRVAARAGRLLMFPPYWMFQHAGLPPVSSDKYILSTYMLFS